MFILLCILSMQLSGPRLLLAADTMTLTALPTSLVADGVTASVITATVLNGLIPEQGVNLTFSTTMGSLSSTTAISNSAGRAIVALTSTNAGVAIVTCTTSSGAVISNSVAVTFTAPVPAPTLDSFVLSVAPPSVIADNITPSTITAQLYDQFGKPLAKPGESVVFTTSFTASPAAHFSNGTTTITVSTDGTGKAVTLIYSSVVGTATVNAQIGSLTANPVYVIFTGAGPPAFISLSAYPTGYLRTDTAIRPFRPSFWTAVRNRSQPGTPGLIFHHTWGCLKMEKKTYPAVTVG